MKVGDLVRHKSGNSARQVGVITERLPEKRIFAGASLWVKVLWLKIQSEEEVTDNYREVIKESR